jgi:hypothetical protein
MMRPCVAPKVTGRFDIEVVCAAGQSHRKLFWGSHIEAPAKDNMKTPLAFDDYTEVLPECEMDQDLKKSLKDMSDGISGLTGVLRHVFEPVEAGTKPAATPATDSLAAGKLEKLEERSKWHRNIGWGIATFFGTVLWLIVTWWIPQVVSNVRDGVKSDTAAQLLPLQLQLAKLNALMELKQSKDVAQAISQSADFSTPAAAIEAVRSIAVQAKSEKLAAPTSVLQEVNAKIQDAVASDPKLKDQAWPARVALLDYRTALQKPFVGNEVTGLTLPGAGGNASFRLPNLPIIQRLVFRGGRQKLDNAIWKDMVFEDQEIEYDGGPMAMQNVRFINCTFKMRYSARASDFANLARISHSQAAELGEGI